MIPKIIHCCWFGDNPKSELIEKCLSSWRIHCPEYQIIEWNEDNWDINKFPYAKAAYEAGKWAFVSDVARLDVLLCKGGIYLDTDVEILADNPFDSYLGNENILVFENGRGLNSGLMYGTIAGSDLCKLMLEPYKTQAFTTQSMLVNSKMNEPIFRSSLPGLKWNGLTQQIGKTCIMGCDEYSALMKHYGTRSWCDDLPEWNVSKPSRLKDFMRKPERFEKLENSRFGRKILPIYTFISYDLQDLGIGYFFKLKFRQLRKKLRNR